MHSTDALKGVGARLEGSTIQGHYFIEKLIQRGGMAWLYKARHKILQEPMAIKILFPQWSDDPLVRVRFIDEAKIQFKLKHPNVVQVTDVIEDGGLLGIVQEWVDGEDLNQYIQRKNGPLSLAEIWAIAEPLLAALGFAHDMGVVHRDIKPSNVLLGRLNNRVTPKLADFGIAKILDELGERTTTGTTLGTMKYIAPEQIRDSKTVDHRADIYGFGVMLYRMATGEYPFSGKLENVMFKQLYEPPPKPRELNPDIDPELEEVILQCLTKHPEDRFPDCNEVSESLRPLMPQRDRKTADNDPLFAALASRPENEDSPYDALEDSSPSGSYHPRQGQPPGIVFGGAAQHMQHMTGESPFADSSSPDMANSIEALRSMQPRPNYQQGPPGYNNTPMPYGQRPPSFHNSPYSPPHPHNIEAPHRPVSPFASPGEGDSPWGEFMLETEDEYEIDDTPTEVGRDVPPMAATSAPSVGVGLGSNSTGSFVPFAGPTQDGPQIPMTPVVYEGGDAPTMLEKAPSLADLAKIGEQMKRETQKAPEIQVVQQPRRPSPATKPMSKEETDKFAEFIASNTPSPPAETPSSPSSASLPARLAGSDLYAMKITPSSQSLDAVPALRVDDLPEELEIPQEPSQPPELSSPMPRATAPIGTPASTSGDVEPVKPAAEERKSPSVSASLSVEKPIGSGDVVSWQPSKTKSPPPIYFYPLIGIALGLVVLAAAWFYMRHKRQSQQKQPAVSRQATPFKRAAKRAKPLPQADIHAGCKKEWPADNKPHRLQLTIEPKEMVALHHPKLRDFVKGTICLEYHKTPSLTLSRNGFDDCTIVLPMTQKTLKVKLLKVDGNKKRKRGYCVAP